MGRNERSRHAGLLRFTRNTSMAAFSFREDNHSACAGWQGFGGGAYQQAFAEVINSALLATTVFSAGQRLLSTDHKFVIRVCAALFLSL